MRSMADRPESLRRAEAAVTTLNSRLPEEFLRQILIGLPSLHGQWSRERACESPCAPHRGDFGKEPHCRLTLLLFHIGFMPVDVVFRYSRLVASATGNRAAAASIL